MQAYDATVHETLLQMHDSLWRERWNCVSTGGFDFANVGAASVAETEKVADNMKVWLKVIKLLFFVVAHNQLSLIVAASSLLACCICQFDASLGHHPRS